MYVLDSSAIIEILYNSKKGEKIVQAIKEEDIASTTICKVEVLIGAKGKAENYAKDIFRKMYVFEFTKDAAERSIEMGKELLKEGKPLEGPDLFIAGICKEQNLPLITCDKSFKNIKGIKVMYIE